MVVLGPPPMEKKQLSGSGIDPDDTVIPEDGRFRLKQR